MDCSLPGSSVHGIFQSRILACHFLLKGIRVCQCHWTLPKVSLWTNSSLIENYYFRILPTSYRKKIKARFFFLPVFLTSVYTFTEHLHTPSHGLYTHRLYSPSSQDLTAWVGRQAGGQTGYTSRLGTQRSVWLPGLWLQGRPCEGHVDGEQPLWSHINFLKRLLKEAPPTYCISSFHLT